MSNAKRPSLAKKQTRAAREKRQVELEQGVELFIDDEHYRITVGDMSALDVRELRRQVGITFPQILDAILNGNDNDLDMYAAVIWLARYVNAGERDLTYAEVAEGIDYEVIDKIRDGAEAERKRLAAEAKPKKAAKKAVSPVTAVS